MLGLSRSNADSVGDGFNGSEGPARSAVGLVSDFLDALAVGVLLSQVEVGGQGHASDGFEGDPLFFGDHVDGGGEGSHQRLDLLVGHSFESLVVSGAPGGFGSVDSGNDVVRELLVVEGGNCDQNQG